MLQYILKRVLIFIPTLIAISLITFVISISAPGDPVENMLEAGTAEGQMADRLASEREYQQTREQLGLHLPIFYFAVSNAAVPDTLHKIADQKERQNLRRLINKYGNWEDISKLYQINRNLDLATFTIPRDTLNSQALIRTRELTGDLLTAYQERRIRSLYERIEAAIQSAPSMAPLMPHLEASREAYEAVLANKTPYKTYIPSIHLYGFSNQYHNWATNFIMGDFGVSYQDGRPVANVIREAVWWTFMISILSMFITYIVAVPLGVRSSVVKGTKEDRVITTLLFILYSLPNFWIATLLILLFGPDNLNWFPVRGVGELPETAPLLDRFFDTTYHLILPLFCWTYASFAFLSRQMRGGMLNVIRQDYIRTARAKGLSDNKVIWKHAFRNSLLPVITLFANVFPAAIGGSIVLETIFSIPGMGKTAFEAIFARNYPIVFTVMMFSAILTLVGYLVADILYAMVDPRISYSSKK